MVHNRELNLVTMQPKSASIYKQSVNGSVITMTYSVPGSRSVGTGESVYKTVVIMSNILLSILTCNPHTQRSGNPKFTIFGNLFTLMMPIVAIDCIFSVNIQFS